MPRIEVAFADENLDLAGACVKNDVVEDLCIKRIQKIRFSEIYEIDFATTDSELKEIAEKVFTDPLVQVYSLNASIFNDWNYFVEVKFHDDVTDNLAMVALEAAEDFLNRKIEGKIRSAKRYYIYGEISRPEAETIAKELLANEIIETFFIGENIRSGQTSPNTGGGGFG